MKITVYSKSGQKIDEIISSPLMNVEIDEKAVTKYLNYVRSNFRKPIANVLDRSKVRGGGRKPWRQKGTGNARAGSIRSPLFVGGGVIFGPSSKRNYKIRLNKNFRKSIKNSIIGHFARNKKLLIIDGEEFESQKTKQAIDFVENINIDGKISAIFHKNEKEMILSFRNLPYIFLNFNDKIDILNLLSSDYLVMSKNAYNSLFNIKNKDTVSSKSKKSNKKS